MTITFVEKSVTKSVRLLAEADNGAHTCVDFGKWKCQSSDTTYEKSSAAVARDEYFLAPPLGRSPFSSTGLDRHLILVALLCSNSRVSLSYYFTRCTKSSSIRLGVDC